MKKLLLCACLFISACASNPESDPAYVSPFQYENYNCKQLNAEMRRVSSKIDQLSRTDSTNQMISAAVNVFAIASGYGTDDSHQNVELKRSRNEYQLVEKTMIEKECNL